VRRSLLVASSAALAVALVAACRDDSSGGSGGGAGHGQGGGEPCPTGPHAAFELTLTAEDGPVPADTAIEVAWSVGKQTFSLDDATTWKSLVDGNVVCDVDAKSPPPKALTKLVCQLWTTGPTRVTVTAKRYDAIDETLVPKLVEACDAPVTDKVGRVLRRTKADGGHE
jgi:hypothetical protein